MAKCGSGRGHNLLNSSRVQRGDIIRCAFFLASRLRCKVCLNYKKNKRKKKKKIQIGHI